MATYTLAATGNWNASATWGTASGFPIAGDTAIITGAFNLTVNVASACTTVTFTNYTGTMTGTFGLTISGNVTFTGTNTATIIVGAASSCSALDFTNFTGTLRLNSTLTVSGNLTFVDGFTNTSTSGTPTLAKTAGGTITVPATGYTWPHSISVAGGSTYTLSGGDLTIQNTLSTVTSSATINGTGLTINLKSAIASAGNIAGTIKIKFTISGGQWAGQLANDNVEIAIAATASPDLTWTSASKTSGTITYTSGNMGVQSFSTRGLVTFVNIGSITFNALSVLGAGAVAAQLTADGDINATTFTGNALAVNVTCTLISSTAANYVIYCSTLAYLGALTATSGLYSIVMNGTGTITPNTSDTRNLLNIDLTFNTTGTITNQTGNIVINRNITHVSGEITANWTGGPALYVNAGANVINTSNIEWVTARFLFAGTTSEVILTSNLRVKNFSVGNAPNSGVARYRNNGGDIYVSGNISFDNGNAGLAVVATPLSGVTATIYVIGSGTITQTGGINASFNNLGVNIPMVIDTPGKYILRSTIADFATTIYDNAFFKAGIFTLLRGTVEVDRDTKFVNGVAFGGSSTGTSTFTNLHRIPFKLVYLLGGSTVTMNEFFCGEPGEYCIVASTTTTNATVTMTDSFEKFARWVLPSNVTITQRGQVKLLSTKGNRDRTNIGFSYFEGTPYGLAKNNPITYQNTISYGILDNPADPNFF